MNAEGSSGDAHRIFFGQLPEFDPDPALWGRIRVLDLRHVRRRRHIRLGILGGTSAVLLLLFALGFPGSSRQSGIPDDLASTQLTSRQLQERLVSRTNRPGDFRARSDLRVIDAELQAAYDRNAADEELKTLWTLRNEVLRSLAADRRSFQAVTRI